MGDVDQILDNGVRITYNPDGSTCGDGDPMTARALAQLRAMLEAFVAGDDVSLRRVNEIEALLSREFRGSPLWEQLSEPLAVYRPEGGEFLLDEVGLRRQISAVLNEWTALTKED